MSPKFGTSGLRGLVVDLTPDVISEYTRAFIAACPTGGAVHIGRDLRASSLGISEIVIDTVCHMGLTAIDHGDIPTPALALASMSAGHAAIMVTGSHIPADRNGLKFYVPAGEVTKADEQNILAVFGGTHTSATSGVRHNDATASSAFVARYLGAFGATALAGLRIGIYEHSSVARDILGGVLRALGAETIALARSDMFIPVDTEAVDPQTRVRLNAWAKEHALDAIVSTDGDGDRPMLSDSDGVIIAGDILGPLTASFLGADTLITPVSSNTLIDQMPSFTSITRTRIGSPYVIAAMEDVRTHAPTAKIAGYEANGGFLLGWDAQGPAGKITALMTRDSVLPIIAPLAAAHANSLSLGELVATLPQLFTASDRVQNIPTQKSATFIAELTEKLDARAAFFEGMGAEQAIDHTDGLRITFEEGPIIHLRPSGNAPECRCYVQASTKETAFTLLQTYLSKLASRLADPS